MRNKAISIVFCLIGLTLFFACQKKETDNTNTSHDGTVYINFNLKSGTNTTYNLGQIFTVNGVSVTLDLIKFYVCDLTLVREDNTEIVVKNYDLMDWESLSKHTSFSMKVPAGNYKTLKFGLGLNPTLNQTNGAQQPTNSVLSTTYGMYWDWASLYIFSKVEGYCDLNSDNNITDPIRYHIGTNDFFRTATVNMPSVMVINPDAAHNINVNLHVDKIFSQTNSSINLATENYTQSGRSDEEQAVALKVADNFQNVFTIE